MLITRAVAEWLVENTANAAKHLTKQYIQLPASKSELPQFDKTTYTDARGQWVRTTSPNFTKIFNSDFIIVRRFAYHYVITAHWANFY